MGAQFFSAVAKGDTAEAAFRQAVYSALDFDGIHPHTGSVAEKIGDGYVVVEPEGDYSLWAKLRAHDGSLFQGGLALYDDITGSLADWVDAYDNKRLNLDVVWDNSNAEGLALLSRVAPESVIATWSRTYNDKWAPALCLPLGEGRFLFCGTASRAN